MTNYTNHLNQTVMASVVTTLLWLQIRYRIRIMTNYTNHLNQTVKASMITTLLWVLHFYNRVYTEHLSALLSAISLSALKLWLHLHVPI